MRITYKEWVNSNKSYTSKKIIADKLFIDNLIELEKENFKKKTEANFYKVSIEISFPIIN